MENQNEKVAQELKELIDYSKNGKEAYDTAIQNVRNVSVKSLFTDLGNRHQEFADELENQVRTLGINYATTSEGRRQSNAWSNAKTAATRGAVHDVLDKFERGESEIEQKFEQVLHEASLPTNLKSVLRKQHESQARVRSHIHELKTSLK